MGKGRARKVAKPAAVTVGVLGTMASIWFRPEATAGRQAPSRLTPSVATDGSSPEAAPEPAAGSETRPGTGAPQSAARRRPHAGPREIASFAPWVAIWVLSGNSTVRLATVVALAASAALVAWELLGGRRPKSLDWGTLVVLAGICALAVFVDPHWLAKWLQPIANGALLVVMVGTIVVGRPFAAEYGRDSVPEEVWSSRAFRKITLGISLVWAAAIGAMSAGSAVTALAPKAELWSTWVVTIGAIIAAVRFQGWYAKRVMSEPEPPAQ